jgi:hypothetical protein
MEMTMNQASENHSKQVRRLNDQFRCAGIGRGSLTLTAGVHERGSTFAWAAIATMRAFHAFDQDNDPYGEHDFGAFTVNDDQLFFKIDYFDLNLEYHSPDAADPALTHRVLTIMLASEY